MSDADRLPALGLRAGERARFRKGARWQEGRLAGVEPDGSLRVHDAKGAARSLSPERVEVRREGPRGAVAWRSVPDVMGDVEQLGLW